MRNRHSSVQPPALPGQTKDSLMTRLILKRILGKFPQSTKMMVP